MDLEWVYQTEKASYDFPWSSRGFGKALDDGVSYVFCDMRHEPIGYACCLAVLDEIHLLNFCIHPDRQKKGVGTEALSALKSYFKQSEYEVIFLEVRASSPAIGLYKKLGFKQDGVRPNYYPCKQSSSLSAYVGEYPKREDAILMSCRIGV